LSKSLALLKNWVINNLKNKATYKKEIENKKRKNRMHSNPAKLLTLGRKT